MRTLVLLEAFKGHITASSMQAISAAQKIGAPIDAIVFGEASDAAQLPHVEKVFVYNIENAIAEPAALAIHSIVSDYTHVVAANDCQGKDILPRAAALSDMQPLTDIVTIESADTFARPVYAGAALENVQMTDAVKFITVRPSSFSKLENKGGNAQVEKREAPNWANNVSVSKVHSDASDRPKLETASIVISGGKAFKSRENFEKLLNPLAEKLHAAIGASRSAVDAEFAPNDAQIGQTGKIVAPEIYLAVGLSGAAQHVAGMQDSKKVFAINLDPDAPIFKVADYGIEADLFEVLPKLTEALSR